MSVWNMEKSGEYLAASIAILNELIEQEISRNSFAQRIIMSEKDQSLRGLDSADGISPKIFEFSFMLVKAYLQYAAILSQLVDHKTALQQAMTAKETLKKASQYFKSFDTKYNLYLQSHPHSATQSWKPSLSTYLDKFIYEIIHRDPTNPDTLRDDQPSGLLTTDLNHQYSDQPAADTSKHSAEVAKSPNSRPMPSSGIQTSGIIFWKHNTRNNEKYLKQELAKRYGENFRGQKLSTGWLEEFNIGNIMHLNSVTFRELDSDPMKDVLPHNMASQIGAVLSEDRLVELVLVYACCLFSVATENRFICHKELETDKQSTELSGPINPVAKNYQLQQNVNFRQSEIYHFKAIEILCSFVTDCPLLNHFLGSYQKNYLPNLESIPEEDPKLVDQSIQSANQHQLSMCGGEYGTIVEPNNMSCSGKSFGTREEKFKSGTFLPERLVLEEMFDLPRDAARVPSLRVPLDSRPWAADTRNTDKISESKSKVGGLTVYQTQIREIMMRQEKEKKRLSSSKEKVAKSSHADKSPPKVTSALGLQNTGPNFSIPTAAHPSQQARTSNHTASGASGSQTERPKSRKQQGGYLDPSPQTGVAGKQIIFPSKDSSKYQVESGPSTDRISGRDQQRGLQVTDPQLQALLQNPLTPRYLKMLANKSTEGIEHQALQPSKKSSADPRAQIFGQDRNLYLKSLLEADRREALEEHHRVLPLSERLQQSAGGFLKGSALTHTSSVTSNLTLAQNSAEFDGKLNSPSGTAIMQGMESSKSQTSRDKTRREDKPTKGLFQTKIAPNPYESSLADTIASSKLLSSSAISTTNAINSMFKKKFSANLVTSGNLVHQTGTQQAAGRQSSGASVGSTSRKSSTSSKKKSGLISSHKSSSERSTDGIGFHTSAFNKQSSTSHGGFQNTGGMIPLDLLQSNRPLNIKIENKDFIAKLMNINIIKINPDSKGSQYVHVSGPTEVYPGGGVSLSSKGSTSTERKAQSASISKRSSGSQSAAGQRAHNPSGYTKLKTYELGKSVTGMGSSKTTALLSKSHNGLQGTQTSLTSQGRLNPQNSGYLNSSRTRSEEGKKKTTFSKDSTTKLGTKRPNTGIQSMSTKSISSQVNSAQGGKLKPASGYLNSKDNYSASGQSLMTSGVQSRPSSSDRSRANLSGSGSVQQSGGASVPNVTKIHLQKGSATSRYQGPRLGAEGNSARPGLGTSSGSGQTSKHTTSINLAGISPSGLLKPTQMGQLTGRNTERSSDRTPRSVEDASSQMSAHPPKLFALLNGLKEAQTLREERSTQGHLRLGADDLQKASLRRALKEHKPLDTPDGLGLTLTARSQHTPQSQQVSSREKKPRAHFSGADL